MYFVMVLLFQAVPGHINFQLATIHDINYIKYNFKLTRSI